VEEKLWKHLIPLPFSVNNFKDYFFVVLTKNDFYSSNITQNFLTAITFLPSSDHVPNYIAKKFFFYFYLNKYCTVRYF
jgi:hypothetical protein